MGIFSNEVNGAAKKAKGAAKKAYKKKFTVDKRYNVKTGKERNYGRK